MTELDYWIGMIEYVWLTRFPIKIIYTYPLNLSFYVIYISNELIGNSSMRNHAIRQYIDERFSMYAIKQT